MKAIISESIFFLPMTKINCKFGSQHRIFCTVLLQVLLSLFIVVSMSYAIYCQIYVLSNILLHLLLLLYFAALISFAIYSCIQFLSNLSLHVFLTQSIVACFCYLMLHLILMQSVAASNSYAIYFRISFLCNILSYLLLVLPVSLKVLPIKEASSFLYFSFSNSKILNLLTNLRLFLLEQQFKV